MLNICQILPYIVVFFYSSACLLNAQNTIIGKVLGQGESTPIAGARIFLAGTIIGDISSNRGSFQLKNIPSGTHQIVVSSLGYKLHKQTITIENSSRDTITIILEPDPIKTRAVRVTAERPSNYRLRVQEFTEILLGGSENGREAELVNAEVLEFTSVVTAKGSLYYEVTANEPLVVLNKRLGLKLHLILESAGLGREKSWFQGPIFFMEVPARDSEQLEQWEKNRFRTSRGSIKHFLLTLLQKPTVQGKVDTKGFRIRRINDTETYLQRYKFPAGTTIPFDSIPVIKDSIGTGCSILFPEYFEVTYEKVTPEQGYMHYAQRTAFDDDAAKSGNWRYRSLVIPQKTIVRVDAQGYLYSPDSLLLHGFWAWQSLADEVPLSYYAK